MLSTKHCDFRVAEFYSNTVLLQFRSEPHVLEYHIQIIGYNKANSVLLDLVENVKLIWTVPCCTQFFMGNKLKFTSFILSMWVCVCVRENFTTIQLGRLRTMGSAGVSCCFSFIVLLSSFSCSPPARFPQPLFVYLFIY